MYSKIKSSSSPSEESAAFTYARRIEAAAAISKEKENELVREYNTYVSIKMYMEAHPRGHYESSLASVDVTYGFACGTLAVITGSIVPFMYPVMLVATLAWSSYFSKHNPCLSPNLTLAVSLEEYEDAIREGKDESEIQRAFSELKAAALSTIFPSPPSRISPFRS